MRELSELRVDPGTRVFVRADLNVPLDAGRITDDLRIHASIPTIRNLADRGAVVLVASHLGRPKGRTDPALSLAPVAERLGELLGRPVPLLPMGGGSIAGSECRDAVGRLAPGDVAMLENLRFEPGEEKNDPGLVDELASLADVYVNDAFGSSHRAHASVDGLCRRLPHAMGLLVADEVRAFRRLLEDPPRPFIAIIGGAKVSDKLGVINALLDKVDRLLVGGAMMFTFIAAGGGNVGRSLVEEDRFPDVESAGERSRALGKEIVLPVDVVCAAEISSEAETVVCDPGDIPDDLMGLDIGPETTRRFAEEISAAGSVLWNGPMGVFETPPFDAGTRGVAEAFASTSAFTVAGGGDSAAALRQMGLDGSVDHLSTGGGASLELIEMGDLPGLEALRAPDPA